MGCDKASLRLNDGRTLLARQVDLLHRLQPAEILVAQRREQPTQPLDFPVTWLHDDGESGPLGGLVACLEHLRHPHLLVLAVDLPAIDAECLQSLLAGRQPGCGVVPVVSGGREPLATVYPREALGDAAHALRQRSLALQSLLGTGLAAGWLREWIVPDHWRTRFANWNEPRDVVG